MARSSAMSRADAAVALPGRRGGRGRAGRRGARRVAFEDIRELYLAADALITDYSSAMFDFAITGKPLYFYTYDLAHYRDEMRGFYFDFEAEAPGPLCMDMNELHRGGGGRRPVRGARSPIATAPFASGTATSTTAARGARGRPGVQPR
jgi:hypothetical protein